MSIPICLYSGDIIVFPFVSITPYKLFCFTKYNSFWLSMIFISSYTVLTFIDVSFPITPYLLLLFTKKSEVAGKYFISSYLNSNIGFPLSTSTTP